jgi:hypothetical protein
VSDASARRVIAAARTVCRDRSIGPADIYYGRQRCKQPNGTWSWPAGWWIKRSNGDGWFRLAANVNAAERRARDCAREFAGECEYLLRAHRETLAHYCGPRPSCPPGLQDWPESRADKRRLNLEIVFRTALRDRYRILAKD